MVAAVNLGKSGELTVVNLEKSGGGGGAGGGGRGGGDDGNKR